MSNSDLDAWDRRANLLLLAYVRATLAKNPRAWGQWCVHPLVRYPAQWQGRPHGLDTSQQATSTRIAVALKHRWAQEMAAHSNQPAPDVQREAWNATLELIADHIGEWLLTGQRPAWLTP